MYDYRGGMSMNTNAVAKLLGVSPSTIQRWVKHANLQMNRNELGHYVFNEEDIDVMKKIQEQINNGVLLQDIAAAAKKKRHAVVKQEVQPDYMKLLNKINELEAKVDRKADEIVSYQLLQHRREIEELNEMIEQLTQQIEILTKEKEDEPDPKSVEMVAATKEEFGFFQKLKKKKLISSLFGF